MSVTNPRATRWTTLTARRNPRPPAGPPRPGNRRRADGRRRSVARSFGAGAATTRRSRHGPHAALGAIGEVATPAGREPGAPATDGRSNPGNGTPGPLGQQAATAGRPDGGHLAACTHPNLAATPRCRAQQGTEGERGTDGQRSPLDVPTASHLEEKEPPHGPHPRRRARCGATPRGRSEGGHRLRTAGGCRRSARAPGANRREADDRGGRPAANARAAGMGEGDGDVAAHPGGHPRGQVHRRGRPRPATAPLVPRQATPARGRGIHRAPLGPSGRRGPHPPRRPVRRRRRVRAGHLDALRMGRRSSGRCAIPRQGCRVLPGARASGGDDRVSRSGCTHKAGNDKQDATYASKASTDATPARVVVKSPGTGWSGSAGWAASRRTLGGR